MKFGVQMQTFGASNRCLTIKTKKEMKKILFLVAAVVSMVFTACIKEELNVNENAPVGSIEFTASFDAETKTILNSGRTEWVKGDEISINGVKFTANASGASVKFTNAETPQGEFKAPFKAVYPYSSELPATQTVKNGTFADKSVVSVAYIEGNDENNLTFKHVSSVIKFQVATEGVTELVFSSSKDLAGKIIVDKYASYSVSDGSKTITVKPENGTFSTSEIYYVSVLPTLGTDNQDFAIQTEGVTVKSGNVKFVRNTIADAKSIEVKYTYMRPSLVWNIANPRYAAYFFADGNKEVWVDMNDGDKDGIYRAVVPEGFSTVVYCRMDPGKEANNWENRWNQTGNINVNIGNVCMIKPLIWDNGENSTWYSLDYAKTYRENVVYLKPNSNWKQSNAWFAAYLCNGSKGTKWLKMESVDGTFYGVELPSDFNATNYKNIIFVRMDSGKTALDWGSKWNQSGDLACTNMTNSPYNRCCAINSGQWECGSNVTWTTTLK